MRHGIHSCRKFCTERDLILSFISNPWEVSLSALQHRNCRRWKRKKKKKKSVLLIVISSRKLNSHKTIKLWSSEIMVFQLQKRNSTLFSTVAVNLFYPKKWGEKRVEVRIQRKLFGIHPRELLSPLLPSLPEAPTHQITKKSFQGTHLCPS